MEFYTTPAASNHFMGSARVRVCVRERDSVWIVSGLFVRQISAKMWHIFYEAWGLALFVFAASCRSQRRRLPFLIGNSPSLTHTHAHTRTLAALKQTDYVNKESQRCSLFGNLVSLPLSCCARQQQQTHCCMVESNVRLVVCVCVCLCLYHSLCMRCSRESMLAAWSHSHRQVRARRMTFVFRNAASASERATSLHLMACLVVFFCLLFFCCFLFLFLVAWFVKSEGVSAKNAGTHGGGLRLSRAAFFAFNFN